MQRREYKRVEKTDKKRGGGAERGRKTKGQREHMSEAIAEDEEES